MPTSAVCFDVMGTLFDLSAARRRLEALGAPPLALEAWFHRALHTATSITLTGDFHAFPDVAEPALRAVLTQLDLPPEGATDVLASLGELDPVPDAAAAVERLASSGVQLLALTNGTRRNTSKLLARAGLDAHIKRVIATEDVGVYKPHPDVYRRAATELELPAAEITLIAAHAWDVMGARSAGLDAIWVSRLERRWPLPPPQARTAADLAEAAEHVLGTS